jgi:Flp pilus assembly CpaE family ATPase
MQGLTPEQELSFINIDEVASRDAWYKILVSLTRPIDTLVIDLSNLESEFSKKLLRLAKKFPDIIQEFD